MGEPLNQVCGINGVTYDSPCVAVYCGGLAPFDFFRGACLDVVGKIKSQHLDCNKISDVIIV